MRRDDFKVQPVHRSPSVSSNRDTLIGTRLVSLEKIGDSSLFGEKYKGQNSQFLVFLWVFMQWNHRILPKRYITVNLLDKNKGQVLSTECNMQCNKGR